MKNLDRMLLAALLAVCVAVAAQGITEARAASVSHRQCMIDLQRIERLRRAIVRKGRSTFADRFRLAMLKRIFIEECLPH